MATEKLQVGDELASLTINVTPEFNRQILEALGCHSRYYEHNVHPALLIGMSNITKSPSFELRESVAAVHTHEEVELLNPARVGSTLRIAWKVVNVYQRKDKDWHDKDYQVVEAAISDESNKPILRRRITDIFKGQNL